MKLSPGDPIPRFTCNSTVNPKFHFDTTAGRYVVLSFFLSTSHPFAEQFVQTIESNHDRFDVTNVAFFGVSVDANDQAKLKQQWPGIVFFWDFDLAVSRQLGVVPADTTGLAIAPVTLVLDQMLRVLAIFVASGSAEEHAAKIFSLLDSLPKLDSLDLPAPVIVVPWVFEPDFCRTLIDYYHQHPVIDSGFMRDVNGKTVPMIDHSHKRRADCEITDEELIKATQMRLSRRVIPAIRQAFQFNATRIERNIIACYDARDGGHFNRHRDNTTLGTSHRRFAVTINLNAEEFDGGELRFPEFGRRSYRAPTGGAIVFSCSLLHEAQHVSRGQRFAFLPFLYDDDAAVIRQRNLQFLQGQKDVAADKPPVTAASSSID